jgi:hypothetical protein
MTPRVMADKISTFRENLQVTSFSTSLLTLYQTTTVKFLTHTRKTLILQHRASDCTVLDLQFFIS